MACPLKTEPEQLYTACPLNTDSEQLYTERPLNSDLSVKFTLNAVRLLAVIHSSSIRTDAEHIQLSEYCNLVSFIRIICSQCCVVRRALGCNRQSNVITLQWLDRCHKPLGNRYDLLSSALITRHTFVQSCRAESLSAFLTKAPSFIPCLTMLLYSTELQ